VKKFRAARELVADIDRTLASRKAASASPLDDVIETISEGRQYSWTAVYLAKGEPAPAREFGAGLRSGETVRVPVQAGQRVLGVLEVEPGERPLTRSDTLFLKEVAARLAAFLNTRGKYLMRSVRALGTEAEGASSPPRKRPAATGKATRSRKRAGGGHARK
jgi:hypothetical protein